MKEIRLSNGRMAQVDDADFEWLSAWNWHCHGEGRKRYAGRFERRGAGVRVFISMHRVIAGAQAGQEVDHVNGDTLDNQRANLRCCSRFENHRNQRKQVKRVPSRSQYRGIGWMKRMNRWQVRITVGYKKLFIGYHADEIEAAKMYDEAARRYHGEFACVNFPREGEQGALVRAA